MKFAHVRRTGVSSSCVAYEKDGDKIHYAVAWCHPKDQYCKATGLAKAGGRLKSDRYRQTWLGSDVKEFLNHLFS